MFSPLLPVVCHGLSLSEGFANPLRDVDPGYIVNTILETVIIPVIKNKSGDATDKHNYRPIAISTTMSKVLELLMLRKIDSYLYTTANQFGFKQNHGTDMCIYSLKPSIITNVTLASLIETSISP